MRDDKQAKVISLDFKGKGKDKLESRISKLNCIYEKLGMQIRIKSEYIAPLFKTNKISLVDLETNKELGNYIFYPKGEIYEFDGQDYKRISYTICFIRLLPSHESDTVINETIINLSNEEIKSGDWVKNKALKAFRLGMQPYNPEALMKAMLDKKKNYKNKAIISSVIGWVKVGKKYHYVPITNLNGGSVRGIRNINRTFKHKIDENMDQIESYEKMKRIPWFFQHGMTILLNISVIFFDSLFACRRIWPRF